MTQNLNNKEILSTGISKHKKEGSILKPPFRQIAGMSSSSWKDDRLPEMLWAVLLIGSLKRGEALDVFRKVASFVRENPELSDVTHSGIALWAKKGQIEFINLLKNAHPDAKQILQSLIIFPKLPGQSEWASILGSSNSDNKLAGYLSSGVLATLDHQSQEATDCRWIRFLCEINGGKIKFPYSMRESVKGVIEYPNYGDLTFIRPFIRASEIGMNMKDGVKKNDWPNDFWKTCLNSTLCIPLDREEQRKDKIKVHNNQINRTRQLLLLHYLKTDESTNIESRHDSIFGLGFYVLRLLDELVATNLSRGVIGRITLRSFVESYITLTYLLKKDDPKTWDDFRDYGIGKMKLSYLKVRDLKNKPSFIDEKFLKNITNEDRSEEFSDIELGHWDSSDLRTMSEEAGCKEIYDAFYDWTSSFSHGNWGAIRESNYVICANPLHRLHLIPSGNIYPLPGVLEDAVMITNLILDSINSQYPDLNCLIMDEPEIKKISWIKRIYYKFRQHKMQKLFDFMIKGK